MKINDNLSVLLTLKLMFFLSVLLSTIAVSSPIDNQIIKPIDNKKNRKQAIIKLTEEPAVIDGKLDESFWQNSNVISDFLQITPLENAQPAERTEVRLAYDKEFIYVGAILYDSQMDSVTANVLAPGQSIRNDDIFAISIDGFNDGKDVYYFATNLNSYKEEAVEVNNSTFISDWDGIWFTHSRREAEHWIVEMAIPFKTLSFNPNNGSWGFNMMRELKDPYQIIVWSSNGKVVRPWSSEHTGELLGISGVDQGKGLDIKLSLAATHNDDNINQIVDTNLTPSVDIFYKPTPSITTALTLNTDFSATEVDEQQVNLTQYSLFTAEKRDFFLQDAGVFEFGKLSGNGKTFFSRRLGLSENGEPLDINAGAKVTGKAGKLEFGVLAVNQNEDINQGVTSDYEEDNNFFIGRVKGALTDEFSAGIIVTDGSVLDDQDNRVTGVDVEYRTKIFDNKTMEINGWFQQSETHIQDEDQLTINLNHQNSAWGITWALPNKALNSQLSYMEIAENFNPALGFVNRTGIKHFSGWLSVESPLENKKTDWIYHSVFFDHITNMDGDKQTVNITVQPFELLTKKETYWFTEISYEFEKVDEAFEILPNVWVLEDGHKGYQYKAGVQTSSSDLVSYAVVYSAGDFYSGTTNELSLSASSNITNNMSLEVAYGINRIEIDSNRFDLRTMNMKLDIAFNSRMFWNNWLQFNNASEELGVYSRFRWQPNPLTSFDFVVNRQFLNENSLTTQRQDIAAKLSYTLRY